WRAHRSGSDVPSRRRRIVLVAHARAARSFSNSGVLVMADLPDAARTVTAVDTIRSTSEHVSRVRLHRDGNGTLHVIWIENGDTYHIARPAGQSGWREFDVPRFGGLIEWASGID